MLQYILVVKGFSVSERFSRKDRKMKYLVKIVKGSVWGEEN